MSAGPYKVVARQAQQFITLEAARKDPLLGCPVYERIEIRNIQETGTRIAQFRTGALDIVAGNRDLIQQVKAIKAQIVDKPANNMIGLYIFQTNLENNLFRDERLRKAAAYAIDHKLIGETIWKGIGVTPVGLHLAAVHRNLDEESALRQGLRHALSLRSGSARDSCSPKRALGRRNVRPSSSCTGTTIPRRPRWRRRCSRC